MKILWIVYGLVVVWWPTSAFHEFRTVIRNRWSIFEEYGLTGKRFKGKSANWIPKFARRIVSLGERKERDEWV